MQRFVITCCPKYLKLWESEFFNEARNLLVKIFSVFFWLTNAFAKLILVVKKLITTNWLLSIIVYA